MPVQDIFEQFITESDRIKNTFGQGLSNDFHDALSLQVLLKDRKSQIFVTADCVLVFYLLHHQYYECLYLSKDTESLKIALQHFLQDYIENFPIRCAVIGKEPDINTSCDAIMVAGCPLYKKMIRRRILPFTAKQIELLKGLQEDYSTEIIQFASIDDFSEIYTMLCDEFDLYGDNIPEPEIFKENIEKKQVIIIKKDEKIVFIHYFYVTNKIYHAYIDLTHKDYRKEPFYIIYLLFRHIYLQTLNVQRCYEWRDTKNMRMIKMPLLKYDEQDFIYIHIYLFKNDKKNIEMLPC